MNTHQFSAHRGRALRRAIKWANPKRLTEAASKSAAFWKVYKSMASPKKRKPAVSVKDLAECFEKRMNAPDPPPAAFNAKRQRAAEEYAQGIPNPSWRGEEDDTFNQRVTEEHIAWAKEHLKSHYNTAAGIDRVHYQEILAIDNAVLCRLINECLDRNNAPQVWMTTLIAAIPKKNKPLSEADSYRTVGLESCFLKLVCLLIHKRIYTWAEDHNIIPPSQTWGKGPWQGPACRLTVPFFLSLSRGINYRTVKQIGYYDHRK
jgi:hypothetical protein